MDAQHAHHPLDRFADVARTTAFPFPNAKAMSIAIRRAVSKAESASLHVPEHGAPRMCISADPSRGFTDRLECALRLRLHPNTSLHPAQLAGAIGVHRDTLVRWWRGEAKMPGESVEACARFFASQSDPGFIAEVYGDCVIPLTTVKAMRAKAALQAALAELETAG